MHWLLFIVFIFLMIGLYFFDNKKNKANLDINGFPLSPSNGDVCFNYLDKKVYTFQESWLPVQKMPLADLNLTLQYDHENKQWLVLVGVKHNGEIEIVEFWGETEETAISKACCSINQILLTKINQ